MAGIQADMRSMRRVLEDLERALDKVGASTYKSTAIPCDLLVAYSSSKISRWLLERADARRIQEQISGTILIGLGFYIAFQERIKLF